MKKMLSMALCLAASIAWSQDRNETEAANDENVDLYISTIENINVTAEKPASETVTEPDSDIDAILDEAEALEEDEAAK